MSELMLQAVLRMPTELWSGDDLDVSQRYHRYMQAADELNRLTDDITALRKVLLSAQVRLNSPLNMVKCKGFRELMLKINETLKETEVG